MPPPVTVRYKVHLGGKRYKRFDKLNDARAFCAEVASKKNIILSIIEERVQLKKG